jgi:hypothetical protein
MLSATGQPIFRVACVMHVWVARVVSTLVGSGSMGPKATRKALVPWTAPDARPNAYVLGPRSGMPIHSRPTTARSACAAAGANRDGAGLQFAGFRDHRWRPPRRG